MPDDPLLDTQWHLTRIHAPQAWAINTGRPSMTIAIVDTGVGSPSADGLTGTHADLGRLVPGVCAHILHRTSGITYDSNGHGTMVAGVAGATGNNALGVCGVGWNLSIMPVRATNTDNNGSAASFSDIQWGALWASNHGAKIVSISFDGVAEPGVETLGATLRGRGVLLVWPMDNSGTSYTFDHPHVTVVSGTDPQDNLYASSSYGPGVDLAAPAVSIMSTALGDAYNAGTGNSFAAPIVAGAAASVWAMDPWFAPEEVERILIDSAQDIGALGKDPFFGAGLVDLRAAEWLAVVRPFCSGATAVSYEPTAFGIDDLYDFADRPLDISGDGVIDPRDSGCLSSFLRENEHKDMTYGRP
jgi:subtilisin family serine protease